jgi:hypothetical protein
MRCHHSRWTKKCPRTSHLVVFSSSSSRLTRSSFATRGVSTISQNDFSPDLLCYYK